MDTIVVDTTPERARVKRMAVERHKRVGTSSRDTTIAKAGSATMNLYGARGEVGAWMHVGGKWPPEGTYYPTHDFENARYGKIEVKAPVGRKRKLAVEDNEVQRARIRGADRIILVWPSAAGKDDEVELMGWTTPEEFLANGKIERFVLPNGPLNVTMEARELHPMTCWHPQPVQGNLFG